MNTLSARKIHKRHIEAMAQFAIANIPHVDEATLVKFVELINITGNFNAISDRQLLKKTGLFIHLVPGTCRRSLHTLLELLDIYAADEARTVFSVKY